MRFGGFKRLRRFSTSRRLWVALVLLALLAAVLLLQQRSEPPDEDSGNGYAGLGEDAMEYAQAEPSHSLQFPGDHGPHPDYRIEWWYLTANLEDENGEPLGIQWTLFRQALASPDDEDDDSDSPWSTDQLWMAHAALSTPQDHWFDERFARGRPGPDQQGQAGVTTEPFSAWLDDWQLMSRDRDSGDLDSLSVTARGIDDDNTFGYRLDLTAEGPLVLHGVDGFSQKTADGQGSFYYSQPFYRVEGQVEIDGEMRNVSGRAWLDREWSSQIMGPAQQGWDWFSLHLADGYKLMAFRLRGGGEDGGDYLSGSWISPDGNVTNLDDDAIELIPTEHSEIEDREIPTQWRLRLPGQDLDVTVKARHPDRWLDTVFPYWEGDVTVEGSHSGIGFLEMTGY
ncbi:lipocalin-like domain-containing protein [Aidingimonas halophila]|uniref:Predicted secreted hydrolase n=1 Tax=Aidingimonas halophila TaxID=574349 RepID=A0A1H3FJE6_9GAMM|nr:lipocalin-like domain-containing protein [Aidingimonas halophila]GHC37732.1 iron ABC transporter permease [Aidingimonas halophila]SDX91050.1 Predicted secreted hydrolase [Aidingimonas halophila]